MDLEEIKRKQDEEFDFTGMLKQTSASKKQKQKSDKGKLIFFSVFSFFLIFNVSVECANKLLYMVLLGENKLRINRGRNFISFPGTMDLLSEDFDVDETEKDDLTLLNEILNAPATGGDDFSREWHAVFGSTPLSASTNLTPVESDNTSSEFMPSCLLDMTSGMGSMSLGQPGDF